MDWFKGKRERAPQEQQLLVMGGFCMECGNIYCLSRLVKPGFQVKYHTCTKCSAYDIMLFAYRLPAAIRMPFFSGPQFALRIGDRPAWVQKTLDGAIVVYPTGIIPEYRHPDEVSNIELRASVALYLSSSVNGAAGPRLARGLAAQLAGYSDADSADYMAAVVQESSRFVAPLVLSVSNATGRPLRSDLNVLSSGSQFISGADPTWDVPCYHVQLYSRRA